MRALIEALTHEALIYNQEIRVQFVKEDFHGSQ